MWKVSGLAAAKRRMQATRTRSARTIRRIIGRRNRTSGDKKLNV
jgi:hypothetical protein